MTFAALLALALAGASLTSAQNRDYRLTNLDLLRVLAEKPWLGQGPNRWELIPRIEQEIGMYKLNPGPESGDGLKTYDDDVVRSGSKRSAVASAIHTGRRRRQPGAGLGKAVTPYVGVGILNDVGSFLDLLRGNLESLLSPQERSSFLREPPTVVPATSSGGGGGSGIRKLHALRPLRPTGNLRSYNRRSDLEAISYAGANHYDPGLLWTGLGRR